ncbi:MAG: hypothetical protein CM15mP49_17040 [Actinomycetota bacterium]|nr:MAG: hypothetical protein CM15mP49_17040 [Actinomycetota bacterium]
MSIWRENKRTIHHDNPIKVLPGDPQNDARFAVCPDDVYDELSEVQAERSGSELLEHLINHFSHTFLLGADLNTLLTH